MKSSNILTKKEFDFFITTLLGPFNMDKETFHTFIMYEVYSDYDNGVEVLIHDTKGEIARSVEEL